MTKYGHCKTVITAHMEEIINSPIVRGSSYETVSSMRS